MFQKVVFREKVKLSREVSRMIQSRVEGLVQKSHGRIHRGGREGRRQGQQAACGRKLEAAERRTAMGVAEAVR